MVVKNRTVRDGGWGAKKAYYASRSLPFSWLNWIDGVEGTHRLRGGNGALTDRGDSPVAEDEGVCRWRGSGMPWVTGDSGRGSMPNCSGWRNGEGGNVCSEDARIVESSGGGYVGVVGILIGGQSGILCKRHLC